MAPESGDVFPGKQAHGSGWNDEGAREKGHVAGWWWLVKLTWKLSQEERERVS